MNPATLNSWSGFTATAANLQAAHPPPAIGGEVVDDEDDERYKYLMTHGVVRKMDGNDNIIFAELMRIPGAIVVYWKPSEWNRNPDKLIL